MADHEMNVNPDRKRQKTSLNANEQVNNLVLGFINDANSRKISLSGPLIQERARKYATDLGLSDFKASNGWLEKFLKRNNLVFKKMSGERGDVDTKTVSDWKAKLPSECEGYEPRDIFNMDETGIFFKDGKRTTFVPAGSDCAGGKRAKNRITVALCASMMGEKLTPLVIGKSAKPRCFANIKIESLPVTYENNQKAWMNSKVFTKWINSVDKKMRRQRRKILLFVDNAPSHPKLELRNVKVVFLPPNTTSVAQPMDQGIIQAVKLNFYKFQSQHILKKMESSTLNGSELLKQVTVLDTIYWLSRAWKELDITTIMKCFDKCGFDQCRPVDTPADDDSDDEYGDDNIPLAFLARTVEIYGRNLQELVNEAVDIPVCDPSVVDWDLPASELLREAADEVSDGESDSEEVCVAEKVCSLSEVSQYIEKLKAFACQKGHSKFLSGVMELNAIASEMHSDLACKQAKISDFFSAK